MTCGACGATIADKAIVCYRCGAPTVATTAPAAKTTRRRSPVGGVILLLLGLVCLSLGLVLAPETGMGRDAARLAGLALVVLGVFRLIVRRR